MPRALCSYWKLVSPDHRRHAEALLLVDAGENGPSLTDREAAERVRYSLRTYWKRCVTESLARQCLDRRLPDMETVAREVSDWVEQRNRGKQIVDWRFTTEDVRIKLKRLYPKL